MIEVDDILNRLKMLREQGQQIISPLFSVMYNPYTDTFFLDVPEDKKELAFEADGIEDIFQWDYSNVYPVRVKFKGNYENVWKELQPYAEGVTIDLLPIGYVENGKEYIWVEHSDDGCIPIEKSKLQIIL